MPSLNLRNNMDHHTEVNRLMIAAGAVVAGQPVLTAEELFLHGLAVEAGVTPREFVYQILAKRGGTVAPKSAQEIRATVRALFPDSAPVSERPLESRGFGRRALAVSHEGGSAA